MTFHHPLNEGGGGAGLGGVGGTGPQVAALDRHQGRQGTQREARGPGAGPDVDMFEAQVWDWDLRRQLP